MNIDQLEKELEQTNIILDHIESRRDIDINHIDRTSFCKTIQFLAHKTALERELFAQKIVQLCLTGG